MSESTPARSHTLSRVALGVLLGILGTAVVGALLVPFALRHRQPWPFERVYGNLAVGLVSRLSGGGPPQPLPQDRRTLEAGRVAFTGSCAACHGAAGDGRGVFGEGTFPPATSLLDQDVVARSDGQLFWIIKNGLSFTGMPGLADQYQDADIVALVAYMRALQRGQGQSLAIPTPTDEELAIADPFGDTVHRGASVYFAQGCADCHGAAGEAPGELALRPGGGREAIRDGRRGMPAYGPNLISESELRDVKAYMGTFRGLLPRGR